MATTFTRRQIRERMQRRGLVFLGQWTADSTTTYIIDTGRLGIANMDSNFFGEAYVRIQGAAADANSDPGYVGKVQYIDPANGFLYVSPSFAVAPKLAATVNGYEVWKYGIWPDDADRAIDRALTGRCTESWQLKPLSLLTAIENWATAAYSGAAGGVVSATAVPGAMAFPSEWFDKSMVVTASGAGPSYLASPSCYVIPNQTFRVFGWVSAPGLSTIRVRDIKNSADILLSGTVAFGPTNQGWRFFVMQGVAPAGCDELQIWLQETTNLAVGEWAGVGLIPNNVPQFTLERVRNEHEVGHVYAIGPNLTSIDFMKRSQPLPGIHRERQGSSVRLWFDRPQVEAGYGVYYEELTRYAPFVTTEGKTGLAASGDYFTKAGRYNADSPGTPCHVAYAEASAVVELLKDRQGDPALARIYADAFSSLEHLEADFGAEPRIVEEHTAAAGVSSIRRKL